MSTVPTQAGDAPPTTGAVDRRHWTLAVAAGMASFLDSAAIISVGLGLALWQQDFGLSNWSVGFLGSAVTLFIAVGALIGGRVADLLGRNRVFAVTILIYAVGAVLVATAGNEPLLLIGVIVIGLAAGADLPTSLAVLAERAPDEARGRLIAFTHVMWTIGVVTATALGFVVADFGVPGIRFIFWLLAALALATFAVRALYRPFRELDTEAHARSTAQGVDPDRAVSLHELLTDRTTLTMIGLTAGFYLFFTLVANTFGAFKTYFLVTVGGTTQSLATGLSFATTLIGLVGTIVFTRIADTPLRNRFFVGGVAVFTSCQLLIAVTGGTVLPAMIAALVLYNIAFPFIGEALYKVWTQETFAVNARSTVQGATIAFARIVASGFALITPTLIAWSPTGLYLMLAASAVVSGAIGAVIIRRSLATEGQAS